jgi:hypothetical protein
LTGGLPTGGGFWPFPAMGHPQRGRYCQRIIDSFKSVSSFLALQRLRMVAQRVQLEPLALLWQ